MGEVYRARDTRLNRDVAIKTLPAAVADNPSRRARFAREAQSISQLCHPNICTVHDVGEEDGIAFLVMEHIEGESLEKRLRLGPLPWAQALEWAIQIAGAIDAAHKRGIIHRDLKPANIMVAESGMKLLDFGLAKLLEGTDGSASDGKATESITAEQKVIGTLHYMSPEQLEGREVDARTDVFAFGVTLYEMVTGRKAFAGSSAASVSAAILTSEPAPVSSSAAGGNGVPTSIDHILRRALAKQPDERWQTARDMMLELRWLKDGRPRSAPAVSAALRGPRWLAVSAVAVAVAVLAGTLGWQVGLRQRDPDRRAQIVFTISAPDGMRLGSGFGLKVSPDGRKILFAAVPAVAGAGTRRLWYQSLDSTTATPLPGTEDGSSPFWSPDSASIGFYSRDAKLKRVPITGGTSIVISDLDPEYQSGRPAGFWSQDGTITFGQSGGLFRVNAGGGTPVRLTSTGAMPGALPNDRFLYLVARGNADRGLKILGPGLSAPLPVAGVESNAVFAAGYLVFRKEQALVARPFDARRAFDFTGPPVTLAAGVYYNDLDLQAAFDVSEDTLVYRLDNPRKLTWKDREGRSGGSIGELGRDMNPAIAPDGSDRVALDRSDPKTNNSHVWIIDPRGRQTQVTSGAVERWATWSHDGKSIVYLSGSSGTFDLRKTNSMGTGAGEETLRRQSKPAIPLDVSSDGRFLIYHPGQFSDVGQPRRADENDLWALPLTGNDRTPVQITHTPDLVEKTARLSSNGRWLAYASGQGEQSNIWVQEFPSGAPARQISVNGGMDPNWRADGKELFYVTAAGSLMAVSVTTGPSLAFGTPVELFKVELGNAGVPHHLYSASPDGRRFLVSEVGGERQMITVVVNWTSLVR